MPYNKNSDLPASVKDHLPEHAQDIYRAAFNSAWKEYSDSKKTQVGKTHEQTAHSVAWAAVEKKYKKSGDKWIEKK